MKATAIGPQVRIAGWHRACQFAACLDRAGYRFTDNPGPNLRPGEYTGRPLPVAPDVPSSPWLVVWQPGPATGKPSPESAPKASPRMPAALEATREATVGSGLLVAGVCLAILTLRLAWALSEAGATAEGMDVVLILASLAAANALLFAAAGRIVPIFGNAWRAAQCRAGHWLLARSASAGT